ncbi:MAG: histidine phosphatase family protein [Acidimicrobiia bacterium]
MTEGLRQLLVLRHAKSAWPVGVADAERPLSSRGERAADTIGRFLAVNELLPDHVACSPARRTRQTADAVLRAAGAPSDVAVSIEAQLYDGDVFQVVRELPDEARRALVVGHEPELVELVRTLCGADVRLPTGALAVIELEAPWPLQPAGRGVLRALVTPKLLGTGSWTTVPAGT